MEQVKKKIAQLKVECDEAKAQLDDAKREKKEADERADAVSRRWVIRKHPSKLLIVTGRAGDTIFTEEVKTFRRRSGPG